MYKDVRDIFGYSEGVLALKLRGYEKLGLSAPTVVKLVSCSPSLLVGGVNEDFVRVLEKLKGLGVSSDWFVGHLSYRSVYDWSRMHDMMCFLEKLGCNKKDIGWLFEINPAFLIENSGKKVYVLISMLLKEWIRHFKEQNCTCYGINAHSKENVKETHGMHAESM
ncbi:hypothetical protein IFM89_033454 [Coptis chinensis]|uniref:Uncharacterized protein n=1 Tax=Coptis chinensis TaxID=261450 RepID=A0A835HZF7_9MAGN|nr:hypothetical protein IFM89_033454 [Coptis chinensis]